MRGSQPQSHNISKPKREVKERASSVERWGTLKGNALKVEAGMSQELGTTQSNLVSAQSVKRGTIGPMSVDQ